MSMSLVHEKLYLSRDLSKIDFYNYLSSLISNLYRFYNLDMSNVALRLDVKDIEFSIDTAIPCGLIVNELITNSLKYAFPQGRAGEVSVTLRNTGKGDDGKETYELTVKDNGIGIPKDLALTEVKSLGLYLVRLLVKHQLGGTIDFSREQGTEFVIRFKEIKYKKRI
jgi:two-component system, sensor histidine kinase PdtaS